MRHDIILAHADARVPRYTSYPTAPHFTANIGPDDYAGWLADLDPRAPVSLYLHVPFCRSMCWYCGCHTRATRRAEPVDAYAAVLLDEIELVAARLPARMKVSHVHWGGGSPTYLSPARFVEIMDRLRARFDVLRSAEIAVEVDPRIFSGSMAWAFRSAGVTRASLGVQTFDPGVQEAVNRIQDFDLVADCVTRLRAAGIDAFSMDLLYGLPLQTEANCRDTARKALSLDPDRFSVFGYAHVPHMKPHQKMISEDALPGAAERLAQADAIAEELVAGGCEPIGLDHFARRGDALTRALRDGTIRRNFQGYTTDTAAAIIGLGASAIGWLPQGYVQNTPATHAWERAVLEGRPPTARGYALTDEDRMRRAIIEQLMCRLEADPDAIAAEHGLPAPDADLSVFLEEGVVEMHGSRIVIDPAFRPLARSVAAAFDARLAASTARHAVAV